MDPFSRCATLLLLPSTAIDTVGLPMIAARLQASDRRGAQRLIARLAPASFLISAAGGLAMALLGAQALALFKPDFAARSDVLLVLCLASVANSFFGPGAWLLVIGGGERFNLASSAALFSAYAALATLLAARFGILGMAWANVALVVATNVVVAAWVRRRLGIDNLATSCLRSTVRGPGGTRPATVQRSVSHAAH